MHALTQAAFHEYAGILDPPSGALRETVDSVRRDLEKNGGALARDGDEPVGCLRFDLQPGHLHVRRVAVPPRRRRTGVGTRLMEWAHEHARSLGLSEVRLGVRAQLSANVSFYERLGYERVATHRHRDNRRIFWHEMRLLLD